MWAQPGRPSMILVMHLSKTFEARCTPKGNLLNLYLPNGMLKVSRLDDSLSRAICQYPELASILENLVAPAIIDIISSGVGSWLNSRLIALFKSCGSRQTQMLPSTFSTETMLLTQSVGWSTFSMTFSETNHSSSAFNV